MLTFQPNPEIPATKTTGVFVQAVKMMDDNRTLGRAIWAAADPSQGVIQLVEFWIDPAIRRSGYGRRLMRGLIDQARSYHKLRKENLRRIWVGVGHKSHVVGRAFLSSEGFHHISTTGGLMKGEDQLIYVKSLD
jgi:GNAT superfamily N-acetyltransferase